MKRTRKFIAVGVLAILLAGCGIEEGVKSERGRGDAPRTATELIDGRPADGIIEFPDGWGNVATKCVWKGFRAFESTKGNGASALVVVADDSCTHENTGPHYRLGG